MVERLKVTSHGSEKAVTGNRRGFTIQEPSTTLEEMLVQLPEHIAFDLEMSRFRQAAPSNLQEL